MAADRRPARTIEHVQERPFGGERKAGRRVQDRGESCSDAPIAAARDQSDRPLPDRGEKFVLAQYGDGAILEPKPPETGQSQDRRVELAGAYFSQPRFDIAAQQPDFKIGPQPQRHRAAPQGGRAETRVARQRLKARAGG